MKVVIIGAGPAGVSAAETLRAADSKLEIAMISREPFPPYSPPVLATFFLEDSEFIYWRGRDFAERNRIDYLSPKRVIRVDPVRKLVEFADESALEYDRLILAVGSTLYAPIRSKVTNPAQDTNGGFFNFKSMNAALKIREIIREGSAATAVIVGAGFIGTELAVVLNELGLGVTQVEMEDRVMPRILDEDSARIVQDMLERMGIRVLLKSKGVEFFGQKTAHGLALESGEKLNGNLMVAATGVKPNVDFLHDSGFSTKWGLIVDDFLQTNFADVYAAGDCAEPKDRITGDRYVHAIYLNARQQGQVAAQNALGMKVAYEGAHNMNSLKHLGIPLIALGSREKDEELVYSSGDTVLRKLYLTGDRLTGARLVGDIKNAGIYFSLMNRKVNVAPFKEHLLSRYFGMGLLVQNGMVPPGTFQGKGAV